MPRTVFSAEKDAQNDLAFEIRKQAYAMAGSLERVAPCTSLSKSTLQRRVKNIDALTIGELRSIRKGLRLPKERVLACLEKMI